MKQPLLPACLALLLALAALLAPAGACAQALAGTFAAGTRHSLTIHADGTLWATGENRYGQLGTGTATAASVSAWVQVGTATTWVQVAAGGDCSLGLQADGTLWAWGNNYYGQLGNATNLNLTAANPTPTQVGTARYTRVAAGGTHCLGLQADGTLWAWGSNQYGQLGPGPPSGGMASPTFTPTQVGTARYTQVVAGYQHSLALQPDGSLWAWGFNASGQLGTTANAGAYVANPTPAPVGTARYTQVAAGSDYTLALRPDGTLWAWGSNGTGQLGSALNNGSNTPNPTPTQVGTALYTQVAAGSGHTLALQADGTLWAWGYNYYGQLGNATNYFATTANPTPTQVGTARYAQVAAGAGHTLALRPDGSLWAWGSNNVGQLGAATSNSSTPTPTATGTALPTRSTAAGNNFGLAVKADGTLWAWGSNQYGQLGDGTTTGSLKPKQIGTAHDWVMVAAGGAHSLGLRADGTLYSWGRNDYGQLGNAGNGSTPTLVVGTYTWVAAGYNHSLGLRADGTLYAWGSNLYGQLGNPANSGTTSANPTPLPVAGTYTQVVAGAYHSLGLRAGGSLYAWGYNAFGQLGNGTSTPSPTPAPTQVPGTYTQVAAGGSHSLGLRADGSLYAWGLNKYGQVGNLTNSGTFTPVLTPTQAAGTYVQVAAGGYHSLGRQANGTLYAWGNNEVGQLGNGTFTTTANPTPTQEATLGTGWTTLASGPASNSSLVRTASGLSFASAGYNNAGQLGDGTTTDWPRFDRTSPLSGLQLLPVRAGATGGNGLMLYPNPTAGAATLTGAAPGQAVQVLDALGRVAATATADATGAARLEGLAPGLYVVRSADSAMRLVVE